MVRSPSHRHEDLDGLRVDDRLAALHFFMCLFARGEGFREFDRRMLDLGPVEPGGHESDGERHDDEEDLVHRIRFPLGKFCERTRRSIVQPYHVYRQRESAYPQASIIDNVSPTRLPPPEVPGDCWMLPFFREPSHRRSPSSCDLVNP